MDGTSVSPDSYENAFKVIAVLQDAGFGAKVAGGAVRDYIMGREPNDVDVATTAVPMDVLKLFNGLGYRCIPTGFDHGTVTVVMDDEHIEVTTLRRDVETDGRRAVVEFTNDWKEDAARRDFTMNAMFMDENFVVIDFFGGSTDIEKNTIRFVGDPKERIAEDGLRILRLFRFAARFGFWPDMTAVIAANKVSKYALRNVSAERIATEVEMIIDDFDPTVISMMNGYKSDDGCVYSLNTVLFGRDLNPVKAKVLPYSGWEMTLHSMGVGSKWFEEHRCSSKVIKKVRFHEEFSLTDVNYDTFIYGYVNITDHVFLKGLQDTVTVPKNIPKFPVSGDDVMELGYEGSDVGRVLATMRRAWCNSDFKMTRDDLLKVLKQ